MSWFAHASLRAGVTMALLLLAVPTAGAQDTTGTGTVRGSVTGSDGRPAADTALCIPATSQCVVTDANGRFEIVVRPGEYAIEVAAAGRPPFVTNNVRIQAGVDRTLTIELPAETGLEQRVVVTAPAPSTPPEVTTSAHVVAAEAVATSAGALQDVARYVQALPGVAIGTDDFRNDLIVRGGSPLENLYIVDNIEIPNINTFANFASAGGTVSILDVKLIDNVTFLTGGYPAAYGNRTSSVLQVTQREGRRDRIAGLATVGFAGAGLVGEGPIGGAGRGSWIASLRRSFLDLFTSDTGIGGVPVLYTGSAKAVYDLSPRDRLWAVTVAGVDRIRLGLTEDSDLAEELSNLDIQYRGWRAATGVNWQRVYSSAVGLLGVTHSQAKVNQRVADLLRDGLPPEGASVAEQLAGGEVVFREQSSEDETALKYDLTISPRFINRIQAGGSVRLMRFDYDTASPFGNDSPYFAVAEANPFTLRLGDSTLQAGAYAQGTVLAGARLSLTGGIRVDHFGALEATRVSPRAGAEYRHGRVSLRAAYGQYTQQPFFLFLTAYPENRSLLPIRSDHYVLGGGVELPQGWRLDVEGYRKLYRRYPVSTQIPQLSLANIGDTFAVRDILFPMTASGRGRAQGVEVLVERRRGGRANLEANISWARARHAGLDGVLRPGSFDHPVIANVLGDVALTERWRLSGKLSYLAGRPYTPIDPVRSTAQRRAVYDLSRANAERAPDYARIDLRLERRFRRNGDAGTLFFGAQNVTNRKNFSGYRWDRRNNVLRRLDQLGVFPILGVEWPLGG